MSYIKKTHAGAIGHTRYDLVLKAFAVLAAEAQVRFTGGPIGPLRHREARP